MNNIYKSITDREFIIQARQHNRNAMHNTPSGQWLDEALRRLERERRWRERPRDKDGMAHKLLRIIARMGQR